MADTYEQNLAQKSAVTISDYVRLVGTDNVSYKQPIHSMCAPYANPSGTDLLSVVKALNQGTYFYRMDNVSGFPETGGVVFRIVKTHGTDDARASILAIPMNTNANIYTAYNTSASASSITWVAQTPQYTDVTATTTSTGAFSIPSALQSKPIIDVYPTNITAIALRRDSGYFMIKDATSMTALANTSVTLRIWHY